MRICSRSSRRKGEYSCPGMNMSDAGHCWRDHQRDELVVRCHRQDLKYGLEMWANGTRLRLHLVSIVQLYKALGGGWAYESDANKAVGSG